MRAVKNKTTSMIEMITLILLVGASIWIPRQESLFKTEKIVDGKKQTESYIGLVGGESLMMTSDKIVLPQSWSDSSVGEESKILKLRSKQVRFVQMVDSVNDFSNVDQQSDDLDSFSGIRAPASTFEASTEWLVDSVKWLGTNGHVETLDVAAIDGERTTPYIELSKGTNEFSIVYRHAQDRTKIQRKKIRLVSGI